MINVQIYFLHYHSILCEIIIRASINFFFNHRIRILNLLPEELELKAKNRDKK